MAQEEIVAIQILDGAQDANVFEQFIYRTFKALRKSRKYAGRRLVAFIDNARIHKKEMVLNAARRLGVDVIYNAPYSPHTMPCEAIHNRLKQHIRGLPTRQSRSQMVAQIRELVHALNEQSLVARLWLKSLEVMGTMLANGRYYHY